MTAIAVLIIAGGGFWVYRRFIKPAGMAATVGGQTIKTADVTDLVGQNVGFANSKDALDWLIAEKKTEYLAAKFGISVTDQEVVDYAAQSQGTDNPVGFLKRKLTQALLEQKLKSYALGQREGQAIVVNFDRYHPPDPYSPPDGLTDAQRAPLDKQERVYADQLINDIAAKLKVNQISFEQGMALAENDPRLGTRDDAFTNGKAARTKYYSTAPFASGNFTADDYNNQAGVFTRAEVVAAAQPLAAGQISQAVVMKTANGVEARWVIIKVTKITGSKTDLPYQQWVDQQTAPLKIRNYLSQSGGLIGTAHATVSSCPTQPGSPSAYGVNTGSSSSAAGMYIHVQNNAGTLLNVNFRVDSSSSTTGVDSYDSSGVRVAGHGYADMGTGDTVYCDGHSRSDSGYISLGMGISANNFGNRYALNCTYTYDIQQLADYDSSGPYGGTWRSSWHFRNGAYGDVGGLMTRNSATNWSTSSYHVSNGSTVNIVLTWTPKNFVLTLNKLGTGTGAVTSSPSGISCSASCTTDSGSYLGGSTVVLTESASSGSYFSGWSGSGGCSGRALTNPCTTNNIVSDKTVNAYFNKPPTCSASPNPAEIGQTVTFTGSDGDGGNYAWSQSGAPANTAATQTTAYTTSFATAGTYTVYIGSDKANLPTTWHTGSCTVTVNNPVTTPYNYAPGLYPTPANIRPSQSFQLTGSVQNTDVGAGPNFTVDVYACSAAVCGTDAVGNFSFSGAATCNPSGCVNPVGSPPAGTTPAADVQWTNQTGLPGNSAANQYLLNFQANANAAPGTYHFRLRVTPGSGQSGGAVADPYHEYDATVVVASPKGPYVDTANGDVHAGGGPLTINGCTSNGTGNVLGKTGTAAGSSASYVVSGGGAVSNFGSGNTGSNFTGTSLTLGNIGQLGYLGSVCRPDLVTAATNFPAGVGRTTCSDTGSCTSAIAAISRLLITGPAGIKLGAATLNAVSNQAPLNTLYVNGDVYITGNIAFGSAPFNRTSPLGFGVVASGNIYIDKNVTQLDGYYYAGGQIDTCYDTATNTAINITTTNACNKQLLSTGLLMGQTLKLKRTGGDVNDPTNSAAAEKITYSTLLYIAAPPVFSDFVTTPRYLGERAPLF